MNIYMVPGPDFQNVQCESCFMLECPVLLTRRIYFAKLNCTIDPNKQVQIAISDIVQLVVPIPIKGQSEKGGPA